MRSYFLFVAALLCLFLGWTVRERLMDRATAVVIPVLQGAKELEWLNERHPQNDFGEEDYRAKHDTSLEIARLRAEAEEAMAAAKGRGDRDFGAAIAVAVALGRTELTC